VLLLAALPIAHAHTFEPAVLDLRERDPGTFDIVWKLPGPESGSFAPGDPAPQPDFPAHCQALAPPNVARPEIGAPVSWRIACGAAGLRGHTLSIRALDGGRLDVIVRISWADGSSASGALRSGDSDFAVPGAAATGVAAGAPARLVLWRYGRIGVEHIMFGYDHLLFVLGLLLLVDSWRTLLKTITAFTVAHSLALALAVLGVVEIPSAPVEASIALSIVLVALELTRSADAPPTLTRRYPWAVAFAFGLVHGLGFAGALAEIGLPADALALALLAFNLGVELGQVLFVAAMLAPLAVLRRLTTTWPALRLAPAYAIGSLAVAWMIARVERFWA